MTAPTSTPSKWTERILGLAKREIATWSKDTTKVACVIVSSEDNVILSTGYNGIPRGVRDLPERMLRPQKYLWTAHAEQNAVAQAARKGVRLEGATAYITHRPCPDCSNSLINAGIKHVIFGDGEVVTKAPDEQTVVELKFAEAGVAYFGPVKL